jgi:hypothetical protein
LIRIIAGRVSMPIVRPLLPLALAAALAACQQAPATNEAAAAPAPDTTGVAREEVQPSPTPVAAPQPAAIQSQPGPKGNTVALNRVAVTGDILTVSMTYSGSGDCCVHLKVEDVAVIDDATSQRIGVLKDNTGKWMAAPLESDSRSVTPDDYKSPSVVWFKFPAPPATSRTVSITVPGVAPFDAVPVTR